MTHARIPHTSSFAHPRAALIPALLLDVGRWRVLSWRWRTALAPAGLDDGPAEILAVDVLHHETVQSKKPIIAGGKLGLKEVRRFPFRDLSPAPVCIWVTLHAPARPCARILGLRSALAACAPNPTWPMVGPRVRDETRGREGGKRLWS